MDNKMDNHNDNQLIKIIKRENVINVVNMGILNEIVMKIMQWLYHLIEKKKIIMIKR